MKRRAFHCTLAAIPFSVALGATTQLKQPLRVAFVSTERKDRPSQNFEAFRSGMRELGYTEGRDLHIDAWWGEGSRDQVERWVPDILRAQPDVLLASGGLALGALIRTDVKLPIVFSVSADPVAAGFVQSFSRPGGHMTGVSLFTLGLIGKRLEFLKMILPSANKVALIANPQHPGESQELDTTRKAATRLGIAVRYFPMKDEAELDLALADIARHGDDAIVAFADGFTMSFASRIAAFSLRQRIPAIDGWAEFAQEGNLMIYGPVIEEVYRRLAAFVDKIGRGAKPADLPVELPTRVELVVNLKTARAIGLEIPRAVLLRADRVIR
ncbi:ABC transporter substrate-binding protein [Variovorax sp. YR216]|uniref:ABC transporter substrate-binding protein n=1 Tax=Variovorax sp. YR216 TaxID=1882828 RepID=UPI00089D5567|nr:ABC transporter substrate-binding protein [Variovorax sp. YR216]SEB07931.1 putative ABC transport system substrate-binding protein [Variovorax sp. YR216]